MNKPTIEVDQLSKEYRLGVIGATSFREEVERLWRRMQREDSNTLQHSQGDPEQIQNGRFHALRDISFSVQPGEVMGIIGRNGAGKSTLLKILSRITEPTAGMAKLRGRVASLLEIGTGFHPELTGRENIYLNGTILGMKKNEIDKRFDEIVDFSEIEAFLDTPVKRYSSGMYLRLGFGIAAHLEPKILIVDEVLAVGDIGFQRKCIEKMDKVGREGRTILFVSHNMAAVTKLCSRGILLERGRVKALGGIESVVQEYVQGFGDGRISDLESRTDRKGNQKVRITRIEILDGRTLKPISQTLGGSDLYFKISYKCQDETIRNLDVVSVALEIFSAASHFVTVLNSRAASLQFYDLIPITSHR